ncbi:MAG: dTDP-glucose 4,6-dehydratase [Rhodospirillales bacterium]|nr:dTDP-glucose 4,6-dehydratase [Rhodospirillales bacterium]
MARRLARRAVLRGATVLGLGAALPAIVLARPAAAAGADLGFEELRKGLDERHHVAGGYRASPLLRWGDPVVAGAPPFDPFNQSAAAQELQFGYNCDYTAFLPLPRGSAASDRGLLAVNHETTNAGLIFPKAALRRDGLTRAQVGIELAAHGLSIVEIRRDGSGAWQPVLGGPLNRRITMGTEFRIAGPAAGHERLRTGADPSGRRVIGTLNNCAGGVTPWGTVLSAEENFDDYFSGHASASPEAENHRRIGIRGEPQYPDWGQHFARFDVAREPNEPNRFGWIVEIDPYDPRSVPVKRTALGRFKHEGAATILNKDGRVVVYSGDDERFEYVYRFVSAGRFDPAAPAANAELLDSGVLSVARFEEDGRLVWLPLVFGEGPLTPANGFKNQADVLIEARHAADLLGATPMDRPEDIEPNPATGTVFASFTGNSKRKPAQVDAANPRPKNEFGHILELVPPGGRGAEADHAAEVFRWEVFLLAGDPAKDHHAFYPSAVGADGWLVNPDNLVADPQGRLWIASDGAGSSGFADGLWATAVEGPARGRPRHFFRVPVGAELTGPSFTPDGSTLFASVQHPGQGSGFDTPSTRWPDFDAGMPPRPSVVAITREDGGPIA